MGESFRSTGYVTVALSWAFILLLGWHFTPDSHATVSELWAYLTGDMGQVARGHASLLIMVPIILLVVAIELPVVVAVGHSVELMLGEAQSNEGNHLIERITDKPFFRSMFVLAFLEEVIFRWLLLGRPTRMVDDGVWFYTILLVSNALFAAMHLPNYRDARDRQMLRVVPQFIAGIFFAFVFLKFGLFAAVLAHYAHNAIIFSEGKVQRTSGVDVVVALLNGAYAGIAYFFMSKSPRDLVAWFTGEAIGKLPGWGFWDYVLISVFLSAGFELVADVLLYDKPKLDRTKEKHNPLAVAAMLLCICAIMVVIVYGVYWLAGLMVDDVPLQTLIAATCMVAIDKNPSPSAAQRAFWVNIPMSYLTICAIQTLGFMGGVLFTFVNVLLFLPKYLLLQQDD